MQAESRRTVFFDSLANSALELLLQPMGRGRRGGERDFFAKQRIFLGGNRASRDPGRLNGGVMRNPNYTYADTRQPSPDDEGQQESPTFLFNPFIECKQRERPYALPWALGALYR